jgi:hypothetical protein
MSNATFHGTIDITVAAQQKLARGQQRLVREAFHDGKNIPQHVRYTCAIAMAVNDAVKDGVTIDDTVYMPNPKVRAQFGKNKKNLPYLTVGLLDPDGTPYTLTWQGVQNIPLEMVDVAIKHDEGRTIGTQTIKLSLDDAVVYQTGNKSGKGKREDPRPNHDTGKDGLPYPRPPRQHHNRLCAADRAAIRRMIKEMKRNAPKPVA